MKIREFIELLEGFEKQCPEAIIIACTDCETDCYEKVGNPIPQLCQVKDPTHDCWYSEDIIGWEEDVEKEKLNAFCIN